MSAAEKPQSPSVAVKLIVIAVAGMALLCLTVFLIGGRLAGWANLPGPLGTRAGLFADVSLLLNIILLVGLTAGYGLARLGNISAHQYNQTFWVLFNIVLVVFVMLASFGRQVISGIPARLLSAYYASAFIHALLGSITVLLAVYILLRMNKLLPKALRISGWKNLMRLTLAMYWLVGLFGIGTYFVWYVQAREASGGPVADAPAGTVIVPMANYAYNPGVLEIPAGTTVIFRNDDPDPHTITSDNGAFVEGIAAGEEQYTLTFTEEGEFPYFCLYHGAAGGVGMAGVIRVGARSETAALPTAVAPPEPTAQPTPGQPPAESLGAQSVGYGAFRDQAARGDAFDLELAGLPATGVEMHAWLTGDGAPLHLGSLAPDAGGSAAITYVDAAGANLLAGYSGFVVSFETAGSAPTAPSGETLLRSSLPAGALGPARQLLVASGDAPNGAAYAVGLIRMTEELFRHARAVNGASLVGDFDGMNRHIEHMLTLIQGQGGPDYRDFDGDGQIHDPGDGFGILRYADAAAAQAAAAAAAPDATENVRTHAANVQILAANMRNWGNQVVDLVILAHQGTTAAAQQSNAGQALELTRHMLDGLDANGNGRIEPIAGEGGAYQLYFYSQFMAALGAVPEAGSAVATPAPGSTAGPEPTPAPGSTAGAQPTPAPGSTAGAPATAAAPTATPPPATAAPVFITYNNFSVVPAQTTIKAGTTVTFLIEDSVHQPYAGASAPFIFEAPNNLGPGSSWPHTFNTAGTFTILCGYHANMSGTLVVTP